MAQSTDRPPGLAQDVTRERASKTALVLATVAKALATESPQEPADSLGFTILVGVWSYDQAGRSCHGGGQAVHRMALAAVAKRTGLERGEVPAGMTRAAFATEVAQAAAALGYDWSVQLGAERAVRQFPVPPAPQERVRPRPRLWHRAGGERPVTPLAEALRATVLEIGERLEQDAPEAAMTEDRRSRIVAACEPDEEMAAAVTACLPLINAGETRGAYGRRVREAVTL